MGRPDPEPHSPKPQDQTESSISRDCLATTFMTQPYSSTTEEQMQQGIGNAVDIRTGEPSILKHQTCGHRFKDNYKTVIPAIEENNTRSPNHHHFLSKGRANTEVSHRRLQNIQTIIPYRIPQQTQKISPDVQESTTSIHGPNNVLPGETSIPNVESKPNNAKNTELKEPETKNAESIILTTLNVQGFRSNKVCISKL